MRVFLQSVKKQGGINSNVSDNFFGKDQAQGVFIALNLSLLVIMPYRFTIGKLDDSWGGYGVACKILVRGSMN